MDLMLDLETLGTRKSSIVTAIGAVFFDPQSFELGNTFYKKIDMCTADNRTVDIDTIKWWFTQDPQAQKDMISDAEEHRVVIRAFHLWLTNQPRALQRIWANSPSFDVEMMKDVFNQLGYKFPFMFYQERDVRTIKDLAWPDKDTCPNFNDGTKHNALDDAIAQAKLVQTAYKMFGWHASE